MTPGMDRHKWLHRAAVAMFVFQLLLLPKVSFSMPASPRLHELQQADGTTFKARQWGDEHSHGWETESGHSVVFDKVRKGWTYAVHDSNGRLMSSSILFNPSASPPVDMPKHVRPLKEVLSLKAAPSRPLKTVARALPQAAPVVGTKSVPVIMVQFSDRAFVKSRADFDNLLFGDSGISMKNYYLENSYGQVTVNGGDNNPNPFGPVTADNTHDYYGANDSNGDDRYPGTLVYEAVSKAAAGGFKFASYADQTKGCYVTSVMIVHQGTGEEAGYDNNDIWSHKWDLNSAYSGGEFVTTEPCGYNGGGDFIRVNDYTIHPELADPGGTMVGVGVYAHEFGHALGLPDLYDTTSTDSGGAGDWSIMASGSWLGPQFNGEMPGHLDAWSKYFLGWINPTDVNGTMQQWHIAAASTATPDFYKLGTGTPTSGEYFLAENRQQSGYDSYLPGAGMLVWHIDGDFVSANLANNSVNDFVCTSSIPGACSTHHYGVALVQADNKLDLEKKGNTGDQGDPFVFPKSLTSATAPSSRLWDGAESGFSITDISTASSTMLATFYGPVGVPPPGSPGQPAIGTVAPGNKEATITFDPPSDEGSSAITGYTATSNPGGLTATGTGSPLVVTGLTNGTVYTFAVTATNDAGTGAAAVSNGIKPAAVITPKVTFTPKQPKLVNQNSGQITFSGQNQLSFLCSLDKAAFTLCESPYPYNNLPDGSHTLSVQAVTMYGAHSASRVYNWKIDTVPPTGTTITRKPASYTGRTFASFNFNALSTGVTFECQLDGGQYAACHRPKVYTALSDGAHTFSVRARDAAGNVDQTPADNTWAWTVDTTAPDTILSGPAYAGTSGTFTFSSDKPDAKFQCKFDKGWYFTCASPYTKTLKKGDHTFSVRARRVVGPAWGRTTYDPTPATVSWTVQ
jgi:immune inhibitor A